MKPYKQLTEQDETMKKIFAAFFVMTISCMTLFGCGPDVGETASTNSNVGETVNTNSNVEETTSTNSDAAETVGTNQTFSIGETSVKLGDLTISLNDEMESIRESLGEPLEYAESKSCMYDGYDKVYTYVDVEIITYPMNEKDYISSINALTDKAISGSDIQIGSGSDAIVEKYGEENLIMGNRYYIYETDEYGYSFYLGDDGLISAIEVYIL